MGWLAAALALLITGLTPCLLATLRGAPTDRLAGYGRPAYLDVALVLALLSFAGVLVYARFLGRML